MMAIRLFVLTVVTNRTKAQLYMVISAIMEQEIITIGQTERSILQK